MGFSAGGGGKERLFSFSAAGSAKNLAWSKGGAACADGEPGTYVGVLGDCVPFADTRPRYEVSSLDPDTWSFNLESAIVAVGRGTKLQSVSWTVKLKAF